MQAIIDGGWVMKTVVTEVSEDEQDLEADETQPTSQDEPDEEAVVVSQKK